LALGKQKAGGGVNGKTATVTEPLHVLAKVAKGQESRMNIGQKVNILMVDDQPAKLLSYEVVLGPLSENLIRATSATEALEQLLKNDVAVVLMDVSMPNMDGFELADMMRQHPRFQKTAIIFISGIHLSNSDRLKGYEHGAVDYISVPFVPEVLRAKVSVFAELYRKTRQLEELNRVLEEKVEERTRALRERADLVELASEAVIVRDATGLLEYWNSGAELLYGWKREEVVGSYIHEVLQTTFPASDCEIQAAIKRKGRWEGRLLQRSKDGQERIVASRQALKADGHAVLEINRDITTELRAEDALRDAEKFAAMGRIAGTIAHEINNPLEAITNTVFLLRNHPSLNQEAREYAQLAEQELLRLGHISKQTLSFYRESQKPLQVRIAAILDDVLKLQSRRLQLAKVAVDKRYRTGTTIQGFPAELTQVFLNLIENAIQAMPNGGRMRVTVSETDRWRKHSRAICVSVCDTGSGITVEHGKRLFEPFFTTKSTKGTGLGLWISKGIIQKYDGEIRFRTIFRPSGDVTSFRVLIPLTETGTPS
jgi:PAS domain S-box-containing protein